MTSEPSEALIPTRPAPRGVGRGLQHRLKRRLIEWTLAQGGEDLEERVRRLPWHELNEFGLDPYGLDPEFVIAAIAPIVWLYRNYFRVETYGAEHIPEGRVFLIANHSGQIPIDAAMIGIAAFLEADPPRIVRAMFEKWVPTLPYISIAFARLGQVVGTPENARRLLHQGEPILAFPEGVRGISKPIQQRYQLAEFGLGFMRLALETKTPIVPIAVVGAEEQYVSVANLKGLGKLLGIPAVPVIPQLLVPVLGWLPLPTKYRIFFGEPLEFSGNPDDEDAVIEEKVKVVKNAIQSMLRDGLRRRESVFFG
ncbi:MAG: acyltransferase family protein [Deltaproteobacteria bacterium]|nr:MAG: acyltransferase family protein [Deltaproteobacteria bacterium]